MLAFAQGKLDFLVDPVTGEAELTTVLPPEEQLESAAARARPFILKSDPVHHGKVTNAIRRALHVAATSEHDGDLKNLQKQWRSLDPDNTNVRGYSVQTNDTESGITSDIEADRQLAFA